MYFSKSGLFTPLSSSPLVTKSYHQIRAGVNIKLKKFCLTQNYICAILHITDMRRSVSFELFPLVTPQKKEYFKPSRFKNLDGFSSARALIYLYFRLETTGASHNRHAEELQASQELCRTLLSNGTSRTHPNSQHLLSFRLLTF